MGGRGGVVHFCSRPLRGCPSSTGGVQGTGHIVQPHWEVQSTTAGSQHKIYLSLCLVVKKFETSLLGIVCGMNKTTILCQDVLMGMSVVAHFSCSVTDVEGSLPAYVPMCTKIPAFAPGFLRGRWSVYVRLNFVCWGCVTA